MAQHCIEPVLHWEVPLSVRASSSLGAAATTATRAAMGRRVEKRMNIFLVVELAGWIVREAMGCFLLIVNCFATCHFIRRGGPLPPLHPSAHSPFAQHGCRCEGVGVPTCYSVTARQQGGKKSSNLRTSLLARHAI